MVCDSNSVLPSILFPSILFIIKKIQKTRVYKLLVKSVDCDSNSVGVYNAHSRDGFIMLIFLCGFCWIYKYEHLLNRDFYCAHIYNAHISTDYDLLGDFSVSGLWPFEQCPGDFYCFWIYLSTFRCFINRLFQIFIYHSLKKYHSL